MEVHQHTLTARKKWSHYLFEFLMLFLAVFCGFLAEYQLEHKIERDREKQYMRSMIKDLEQDLINIKTSFVEKEQSIQIADSLSELFNTGDYQKKTNHFYFYARSFSTFRYRFYMTDGTLIQLKNSGGLRLIRKQEVVDSLQAYDNLYQKFKFDQELEDIQLRDYRSAMIRIFEVRVFNTMIKNNPDIIMPADNPALFNNDRTNLNEFLMRAHLVRRNKLINIRYLSELNDKATRLIAQIKNEYNLE